jgi:hypothetical protein
MINIKDSKHQIMSKGTDTPDNELGNWQATSMSRCQATQMLLILSGVQYDCLEMVLEKNDKC